MTTSTLNSPAWSEQDRANQLRIERLRRERARRNLHNFTSYTFRQYRSNWHHHFMCETLDRFAAGEIKRLMVFMPPRHGKSELVSRRLPAFLLGRNPDAQIIAASYGASLAWSMNRDVQRIVESLKYQHLFPGTRLNAKRIVTDTVRNNWLRNKEEFEVVGHRGGYKCAGVGGGITGRGFNFGIIDDPVKDQADADSPVKRQRAYDWYTSTFWTRQEADASILLTMTRWHEDDLAGRLIQHAREPGAEHWHVIWFPARAEEELPHYLRDNPGVTVIGREHDQREKGQGLWTGKYSQRHYDGLPVNVGSRDYGALYQNRPAPEEGNLIKRAFFPAFKREGPGVIRFDGARITPPETPLHRFNVADLAYSEKQTADYTVIGHFAGQRDSGDLYLLDLVRARLDILAEANAGKHQHFIRTERTRAGARYTLVEAKALAVKVISDLVSQGELVMGIDIEGDKVARAWSARPTMEAHRVHLPEYAPWMADFWPEVLGFPNTAHDDQVDVLVYGVLHWMEFLRGGGVQGAVEHQPEAVEQYRHRHVHDDELQHGDPVGARRVARAQEGG